MSTICTSDDTAQLRLDIDQDTLEAALLARFTEEALLELFAAGELHGTVHTCIGQELCGAIICSLLRASDTVFSNHRCHGHYLARHRDVDGLVAELMGRATGVCGGIGGSQHLCRDGFYSNGIQGGIVPVAAGLALGHKLRGRGDVSVVFIGDGTLGEGVVYETLNIASKWQLPLLIVLEDNKYSQSTAQHETLAGSICARAESFGITSARADTWHPQALRSTAQALINQMRNDSRPRFLQVETYRLKAHSKGDDTRPREEVAPFERIDPLNGFLESLTAAEAEWVASLKARVKQAIANAKNAPLAKLDASAEPSPATQWSPTAKLEPKRLVNALNETLGDLMGEHESMHILGEDVLSPYGGAFKVTRDLSFRFPDRLRNTPISEAAIVGIGAGLGLLGYRPLVEIMFGDFIGLAFDQIVNHAAKFHQMYNQQVQTHLIVRTPMGGGRGYGPTHSQTLDRHFLGVPGLRVLALNSLTAPEQLYAPLLATEPGPTLVIENKLLYGQSIGVEPPRGYELLHSAQRFPNAWLKPRADRVDLTLLGYGGTSELLREACERLFDEHDLIAQALCVMQIYPFQITSISDVIEASPHLLIIEEGQGFAGFGAEVCAQLAETDALARLRVRRLYPPAYCLPSSGPLEKALLPSLAGIVDAAVALVRS